MDHNRFPPRTDCRAGRESLVKVRRNILLLRRQANAEAKYGAVAEMPRGSFTALVGCSPQRSILRLNQHGWKTANPRELTPEGFDGLFNRPSRRRKRDDVSIAAASVEVGDPEVSVAGQQQSVRAAPAVDGRIERKELEIAAIGLNFEKSQAAFSVNVVHAEKITVRPEGQRLPGGGKTAIERREIQRNRLQGSRRRSEV